MRLIGLAVLLTLSLLLTPLLAEAQAIQARIPRIGVLSGARADSDLCLLRLRQGLRELEYVEGKTHVLELRWSEGRQELIPRLAGELVEINVDLIVSMTSEAHMSLCG
jgi:putative tryptophan/tyrosine transport system substrate-binding protein